MTKKKMNTLIATETMTITATNRFICLSTHCIQTILWLCILNLEVILHQQKRNNVKRDMKFNDKSKVKVNDGSNNKTTTATIVRIKLENIVWEIGLTCKKKKQKIEAFLFFFCFLIVRKTIIIVEWLGTAQKRNTQTMFC